MRRLLKDKWILGVLAAFGLAGAAFAAVLGVESGGYTFVPGLTVTQATALDGIRFTTTGARAHLGTGTLDYLFSDGVGIGSGGYFFSPPGTAAAPSYTFTGDTDTGVSAQTANTLVLSTAGTTRITVDTGITLNGLLSVGDVRPIISGDNTTDLGTSTRRFRDLFLGREVYMATAGTGRTFSATAPTISSGFGTSPSVTVGGAVAFRVNVGTGGSATNGVIGLPTALNGWNCTCADLTTQSSTVFLCKQTASSTTTATIGNFDAAGAAAAWVASDILAVSCVGL